MKYDAKLHKNNFFVHQQTSKYFLKLDAVYLK